VKDITEGKWLKLNLIPVRQSHLIRLSYLNSKSTMASASIMSFKITLEWKQQGISNFVWDNLGFSTCMVKVW